MVGRCNKIIFAVYPITVEDEDVLDGLILRGIISKNVINSISETEKKKVADFKFRYNMYLKFNNSLEKYCKLHKIQFINFDKFLLNKDKTIKTKFVDPNSKYNLHLTWEPLIPIIISQILSCKIKKEYKINLKKSFKRYIEEKKKLNTIKFNKN